LGVSVGCFSSRAFFKKIKGGWGEFEGHGLIRKKKYLKISWNGKG